MPRRKSVTIRLDCCALCQKDENHPLLGDLICKTGFNYHTNCIFASSGLYQEREESHTDDNYIHGFLIDTINKEVRRGRSLLCSYCRDCGASVGCVVESCPSTFHLPCVTKAQGLTIFEGPFPTYCRRHAPKQDLTSFLKNSTDAPTCCICLFSILPEDFTDTVVNVRLNSALKRLNSNRSNTSQPSPPVRTAERKLPRRSCMTVSTPKRIRISVQCDEVQKLSISNSSSWEVSETLVDKSKSEETITVTPRSSSARLPAAVQAFQQSTVKHLPEWLRSYLLTLPAEDQRAAYDTWLHNTIHGMCCPGAWMHRACITGYAVSAALHYIKCPYCADRKTFIPTVIRAGVWVPDRDAAWELVPGAFADSVPANDPIAQETSAHEDAENQSTSDNLSTDVSSEASSQVRRPQKRRRTDRPSTRRKRSRRNIPTTQVTEPESADSKGVLSLVWTNRRDRPVKPRRHTQLPTHPKSPETAATPRRPNASRRRLSLVPGNGLRQATLGSFLSNFRVSPG